MAKSGGSAANRPGQGDDADEDARRERWLSGAADVTHELMSAALADAPRLIAERVREIAAADHVAIVQQSPDGEFVVRASTGAEPGARSWVGQALPESLAPSAARAAAGRPVVVAPAAESGPAEDEGAAFLGLDSVIVVPITGPDGHWGLLAIGRRPARPAFAAAELSLAAMFGAHVALALELAANQARRVASTLGAERERIARDLHDHVIQRLFAIGLALHNVSGELAGPVVERLRANEDELDATIKEIRTVIYRLTGPLVSTDTSLRARATRLLDEIEPVLGYRPTLEITGAIEFGISEDVAHDCAAVLRETLTNVARHARSTAASVLISVDADAILVEVCDNGRGMGRSTRRSGLANLRARADRRSGTLRIEPGRPTGTRVAWSVPSGGGAGTVSPGI